MHNTRCVRADLYDSEFSPPDNGITDTEREFDTLSPEVSFLYDIEVHVAPLGDPTNVMVRHCRMYGRA